MSMRTQLPCFNLSSAIWNAEIQRKFLQGLHTPKGLLYKFCQFFLVWTALKVNSTTSVQSNNWKLENVQDDVRKKIALWKVKIQMKASSWPCLWVTFWFNPVNQTCVPALFYPTVNTSSSSYLFIFIIIVCEWNASVLHSHNANICFWWCGLLITQVTVAECFGPGQLDLCSVARRCFTKSTRAAGIWMSWNLFKYNLTFLKNCSRFLTPKECPSLRFLPHVHLNSGRSRMVSRWDVPKREHAQLFKF